MILSTKHHVGFTFRIECYLYNSLRFGAKINQVHAFFYPGGQVSPMPRPPHCLSVLLEIIYLWRNHVKVSSCMYIRHDQALSKVVLRVLYVTKCLHGCCSTWRTHCKAFPGEKGDDVSSLSAEFMSY